MELAESHVQKGHLLGSFFCDMQIFADDQLARHVNFFCLAQFKSIISTCFVMFDIIDLTTRLGVIDTYINHNKFMKKTIYMYNI